jgi:hypothetical protein
MKSHLPFDPNGTGSYLAPQYIALDLKRSVKENVGKTPNITAQFFHFHLQVRDPSEGPHDRNLYHDHGLGGPW